MTMLSNSLPHSIDPELIVGQIRKIEDCLFAKRYDSGCYIVPALLEEITKIEDMSEELFSTPKSIIDETIEHLTQLEFKSFSLQDADLAYHISCLKSLLLGINDVRPRSPEFAF